MKGGKTMDEDLLLNTVDKDFKADCAVKAMHEISEAAQAAGIADMSLDEINEEISKVRNKSGSVDDQA